MSAIVVTDVEPWIPSPGSDREWPELSTRAPHLVVTMRRYLVQLTTFLAPRSVDAADLEIRMTIQLANAADDHRLDIRPADFDSLLSQLRTQADQRQDPSS
jgi:hypothetical protein